MLSMQSEDDKVRSVAGQISPVLWANNCVKRM